MMTESMSRLRLGEGYMNGKPSRVGASYRLTPVSDGKSDSLPVLLNSLSLNHFDSFLKIGSK